MLLLAEFVHLKKWNLRYGGPFTGWGNSVVPATMVVDTMIYKAAAAPCVSSSGTEISRNICI